MSTGSISLDILLNKILTDAISGGNESIRAIQKRYPSLSEKEAHEILAMVSATAQSNDDSAELVVTAPPSFALKTKPTKVTVREMLMGARKSGNIPYHCGYDVCAAKQNTFVLCESCIGNFRIPSL